MTRDEERIRTGLRLLAEDVDPELDVDTVVAGGERLRRARRARWSAAGLVAAGVVAVVAWPGLLTSPLPAVPIPGTPAPAATAPQQPVTGRVVLPFAAWDSGLPFDQVALDLTRTGDELAVDVAAGDPGAASLTGSYTTSAGTFWSGTVAPGLVVGVIPGQVDVVTSVATGWEPVDTGWLPRLGLTAVAVQRTAGEDGFGGLTWQDANGQVNSSQGTADQADLTWAGGSVTVYRDEALGVWGYIDTANGVRQAKPLATQPVGTLMGLAATSDGDYFLDVLAVGLLPPGGTDPDLVPTQHGITWTTAPLGDTGQLALLVVADRLRQGEPMIESISYTDSAGNRLTYDPYQGAQTVAPKPNHPAATCVPIDADLLATMNKTAKVDGVGWFASGDVVQATDRWWFVAAKTAGGDPDTARENGVNADGLMVFGTDAPAGGTTWLLLGTTADWDGTTPTGQTIPDWREYRLDALGCAGPG